MAALLEDPERRRGIGAAAREWAVARLDWEHAAAAYADLYPTWSGPRNEKAPASCSSAGSWAESSSG